MAAPLLQPVRPTAKDLETFLDRHEVLLQNERDAEEEQTRLLNSNCSAKELERKGLSLGGLGVSGISVGLGGKTMVELCRPLAYHTDPKFPPHTFRTGDPARIEPHASDSKPKKKKQAEAKTEGVVEGIVYKVSKERVVLAVDGSKEVDLPERVRLLKLANSVTFDRMEKTLKHLRKVVVPSSSLSRTEDPKDAEEKEDKDGPSISAPKNQEDMGEADRNGEEPQGEVGEDRDGADAPEQTESSSTSVPDAPSPTPDTSTTSALPSIQTTPTPRYTSSAQNTELVRSLLGLETPTWQDHLPLTFKHLETNNGSEPTMEWLGDKLNDSQKEAIEFCLKADTIACIHGPPGTGKTHTLVELIFQLLSRPSSPGSSLPPRILVATPSNLALDNILLRLHLLAQTPPYSSLLPPGSILRLGHPTRVHRDLISQTLDWRAGNGDEGSLVRDVGKEIEGHLGDLSKKKGERGNVRGKERGQKWTEVRELRKEYRQREAKVVRNVVSAARVVLATCHSAGSKQLNNMSFDVCIVDEATQAVEAVCWVPILKSRKLILAGDPQQLPPTILSRGTLSKTKAKAKGPPGNDSADASPSPIAQGAEESEDTHEAAEKAGNDDDNASKNEWTNLDSIDLNTKTRLLPPRTLETTLFDRLERLYGEGIKRVLTVQYRMNEVIASFPSFRLYNNNLVSSPLVAKRTLSDLPACCDKLEGQEISDEIRDTLEPTLVFFDTAGCEFFERNEGDDAGGAGKKGVGEGSKSNANEAEVVVRWAKKLVELGVPPEEIAVVTPYQAQVSLISEMIRDVYPEMTIGSVDGLQGQEREAIILTLVRSNPKSEVGFLSEYRRLNVAMTRARRQLCVIGDSDTVGKGSKYLKDWMEWLEDNADVRYAGDEV